MGSTKKHKKTKKRSRHRSSSRDSSDSEDSRGRHISSKKKPARKRSTSASSDASIQEKYRSGSTSTDINKYKQKRKVKRRSRSKERRRSRSDSRERRRKRSRSRSRGIGSGRPKEASRSRSRERRRSRSNSRDRRKKRSRSRSREKGSKDRSRASSLTSVTARDATAEAATEQQPAETLKEKMQKALEAAASADAQLRQQGVLSGMTRNEKRSLQEEIERHKAISTIENDGFKMESFQSGKGNQADSAFPGYGQPFARDINHDSAIFGNAPLSSLQANSQMLGSGIVYKNSTKLASDWLLSATKEEKDERWFQKLKALRKQKLEGNPIQRTKLVSSAS